MPGASMYELRGDYIRAFGDHRDLSMYIVPIYVVGTNRRSPSVGAKRP